DDVAIPVRRSTRNKVLPTRLVDYQLNVHELMLTLDEEPRNYNEAKLKPQWLKAMKIELESIVKNNTWKLVPLPKGPLPKGVVPIGLKWLSKIKRNANARLETIRLLIALAAGKGWKIHHLDVKTAFLHGELKEEVYVVQPEGFEKPEEEKKAVYKAVTNGEFIIVAVYVDDLFVTGTSLDCINEFKRRMASQFEMSDLGELTYYLGIEKQTTVALSSCEAEFMAAIAAACQAIWLRELLAEVTGLERQKVIIRVDSKSAIALSKNPVFHGRRKHIHTRYHFIRKCVENEPVIVKHVSRENQRADPLTKALARIRFKEMRSLLGVQELPSSTQKFKG
ncbi:ribonuclease H-like domain, reverse transcriptase, RNA-dependent DNA polymerase, partial [Tanacetum coccineum]